VLRLDPRARPGSRRRCCRCPATPTLSPKGPGDLARAACRKRWNTEFDDASAIGRTLPAAGRDRQPRFCVTVGLDTLTATTAVTVPGNATR